jgi:hypothetical protein
MPGRSINVVVPHSLSQQAAWDRLMSCLSSKDKSSFVTVKPIEAHVYFAQFKLVATITVAAMSRQVTHALTFQVQPGQVQVSSEPADEFGESLEMVAEQQQLASMLTEALK